jgi:G3E family GTPase
VRSDLVVTLADLADRRATGALPPFERVVIETSGLADPAPILHALMSESTLAEAYAPESVVTTVDALTAFDTLEHHDESLRQVALADRIVYTKTDLAGGVPVSLRKRIAGMNPGARSLEAVRGAIAATTLFDGACSEDAAARIAASLARVSPGAPPTSSHRHLEDITTAALLRDAPVHGAALALFISALAENCGADLLRMKGIVNVLEEPDRPAVIHGVQHVYHAPEWLERWPSSDRRTRIVFIGRRLPASWALRLLDLIDDEVADETRKRLAGSARAAAGARPSP